MADQLGTRIREARKDAGLTQDELKQQLGVSLRTVTRYESGETDLSVAQLIQIARITGKPLSYFLSTLGAVA